MKKEYAFPSGVSNDGDLIYTTYGMQLRDYFAAKAMQAVCTIENGYTGKMDTEIAKRAYEIADEMLKWRIK